MRRGKKRGEDIKGETIEKRVKEKKREGKRDEK